MLIDASLGVFFLKENLLMMRDNDLVNMFKERQCMSVCNILSKVFVYMYDERLNECSVTQKTWDILDRKEMKSKCVCVCASMVIKQM